MRKPPTILKISYYYCNLLEFEMAGKNLLMNLLGGLVPFLSI